MKTHAPIHPGEVLREDFLIPLGLSEWVSKALFDGLKLLPLTPEIACDAYRIPDFHGDPADRIIAATARAHHLTWSPVIGNSSPRLM